MVFTGRDDRTMYAYSSSPAAVNKSRKDNWKIMTQRSVNTAVNYDITQYDSHTKLTPDFDHLKS